VANASSFAGWVNWNGGGDWQRIFDFGSNSLSYFFLTPRNGQTGKLRFAIKPFGFNERILDAPAALPTNSWCHVAVTLDGALGLLYLNGKPVATNNIVVRPWQVMARTNYIGDSQFAPDPTFNGRIDSLRIYGRALNRAEIQHLAEAHPSLAHRYSFTTNSGDSIGTAHGRLFGNAVVTNSSLALDGLAGTYAGLHGGLVSGCSAVSLEFWATLGANGDWARVFDFGNSNGASGQNFLFFSPHTGAGSHRFTLSTAGGTRDQDAPGTLDGRTVHVVCIADPATGYSAIYTNGILDSQTNGPLPALSGVNAALSYLGRSLFSADAWLNGSLDEFRIYHGRLTPQEIAANFASGPDALALPVSLTISSSPAGIELTWPSYAVGFELQTSPTLDADAVWSTELQTPTLDAGVYRMTLPLTGDARFVRLRK
jgi:hypothetical protein